jgi:hypothetical protein
MMFVEARYAIDLTIVEVVMLPIMPGTFSVEVSVNGAIIDQTARTKLSRGKLIWNKDFTLYFKQIEPRSPIMITLSVYKKKVMQFGYHLVGSFHFTTADLVGALDRGAWRTRVNLHLKKNQLTAKGSMVLGFNIKSVLQRSSLSSVEDFRSTASMESLAQTPLATAEDVPAVTDKLPVLYSTSRIFMIALLSYFLWSAMEIVVTMWEGRVRACYSEQPRVTTLEDGYERAVGELKRIWSLTLDDHLVLLLRIAGEYVPVQQRQVPCVVI